MHVVWVKDNLIVNANTFRKPFAVLLLFTSEKLVNVIVNVNIHKVS